MLARYRLMLTARKAESGKAEADKSESCGFGDGRRAGTAMSKHQSCSSGLLGKQRRMHRNFSPW